MVGGCSVLVKSRENPLVLVRQRKARAWLCRYRKVTQRVLDAQVREAAGNVAAKRPPLPTDWRTRWKDAQVRARRPLMILMADDGRNLGLAELGAKSYRDALEEFHHAMETKATEQTLVGVVPETHVSVEAWLDEVASANTATHARHIDAIHRKAEEAVEVAPGQWRGRTAAQQAAELLDKGLARSASHAKMIAITDTMWSYNEGAYQAYRELGVTVLEWFTSKDDAVCVFCASMDGVKVLTGDPFLGAGETLGVDVEGVVSELNIEHNIEHPPLHPHCACLLLPVVETVSVPMLPPPTTPPPEVDFGRVDPTLVDAVRGTLTAEMEMLARYGMRDVKVFSKGAGRLKAASTKVYKETAEFRFSPPWLQPRGLERLGTDGWVIDPTVPGVVRHEVGHAIGWKRDLSLLDDFVRSGRAAQLSKYAATNVDECFAEMYAAWRANRLRGEARSLFERVLKRPARAGAPARRSAALRARKRRATKRAGHRSRIKHREDRLDWIEKVTGATTSDAKAMERALFDWTKPNQKASSIRRKQLRVRKLKGSAKAIEQFVNSAPKFPKRKLYRGMGLEGKRARRFVEQLRPGGTMKINATSSFTSKKSVAKKFSEAERGGAEIVLEVKGGVDRSASIKAVHDFQPSQDEVLVGIGTKLRIVRVRIKERYERSYVKVTLKEVR